MERIAQPKDILKQYWGFPSFRSLQEDIIQQVLDGNDTLALMPTGGGKSLCYQVPALCKEGITLVVSPLIALMKDQVHRLQQLQIPAEALYSGMHYREIDRILDNCIYGNIKLLYLSPERLGTELARERISQMKVNLLAVDEAHCISQWGYDFRPSYLQIGTIREVLPDTPVLALTATATPEVVEDIQKQLSFPNENVFQKSFERVNLSYSVLQEENKQKKLLEILRNVKGTGIVYVRNRRKTKEIARWLQQYKIPADFYHGGLNPEERSEKQEQWSNGSTRIMVSTNAFGMGIDKSDVRIVVHLDLPDSLEAYFQEAGRAGRDGGKAYAVQLYNENDRIRLERNFANSYPSLELVKRVYQALGSYYQLAVGSGLGLSLDFDLVEFSSTYKLDVYQTFHCLQALEQAGWIVLTESVFQPSTYKILISREALYDYQLRHPDHEKVLKALLRSQGGAFQHYVRVREKQLGAFLGIPRDVVLRSLHQFHREGVIDYRAAKDKPQMVFLQERVDAQNLRLDYHAFQDRKRRSKARLEAILNYATTPVCRNRQLLQYFGETNEQKCGICDVCTGRTSTEASDETTSELQEVIKSALEKGPVDELSFLEQFPAAQRASIEQHLTFLVEEGWVQSTDGKLSWHGK